MTELSAVEKRAVAAAVAEGAKDGRLSHDALVVVRMWEHGVAERKHNGRVLAGLAPRSDAVFELLIRLHRNLSRRRGPPEAERKGSPAPAAAPSRRRGRRAPPTAPTAPPPAPPPTAGAPPAPADAPAAPASPPPSSRSQATLARYMEPTEGR